MPEPNEFFVLLSFKATAGQKQYNLDCNTLPHNCLRCHHSRPLRLLLQGWISIWRDIASISPDVCYTCVAEHPVHP